MASPHWLVHWVVFLEYTNTSSSPVGGSWAAVPNASYFAHLQYWHGPSGYLNLKTGQMHIHDTQSSKSCGKPMMSSILILASKILQVCRRIAGLSQIIVIEWSDTRSSLGISEKKKLDVAKANASLIGTEISKSPLFLLFCYFTKT